MSGRVITSLELSACFALLLPTKTRSTVTAWNCGTVQYTGQIHAVLFRFHGKMWNDEFRTGISVVSPREHNGRYVTVKT